MDCPKPAKRVVTKPTPTPKPEICQPCKYRGETTAAESYCQDCNENLCLACTKMHATSMATKTHKPISFQEQASDNGNMSCNLCQMFQKSSTAAAFCVECDQPLCTKCVELHAMQKATKYHRPVAVDVYLDSKKKQCDVCTGTPVTNGCKQCHQVMCWNCSMVHKKQKITMNHTLVPPDEMGSEESHDCSPCLLRERKTAAEQYCPECDEFLCSSCISSHKARKATKDHMLIDKDDYSSDVKAACDVCKFDGEIKEASFTCVQCDEKLCNDCKALHKKSKATRDHAIVDVNSLPQNGTRQCDICVAAGKKVDADTFCEQCAEHLCQRCTADHKRRKATAGHTLTVPGQTPAGEPCDPCLQDNQQTTAESFCSVCDENLCAHCTKAHRSQKATKWHGLGSVIVRSSTSRTAILCDLCIVDSNEVKAVKYCNNCGDNLCGECLKYHVRQRTTKTHVLSDRPKMPGTKKHADDVDKSSDDILPRRETPLTNGHSQHNGYPLVDKKKPGQPVASKIKADSLELSWTKPDAFTTRDSYQVRYKDLDNKGKWKFLLHEYTESTILLSDLQANTKFIFQVRMIQEEEEGPYSEPSDEVITLMSPGGRLKGFSKLVEQGAPPKYALPMTEQRSARNVRAKSRRIELGAPPKAACKEKTIMLVGATGTGKSTLVDGLVNYILGVNWNDPYRYTIIDLEAEEKQRLSNQALSQTEWITCYVINPEQGSRLDYKLTIIDTPGFGDTRGLQRDGEIVDQIRELFSAKNEKGVSVIDAVCFLIKAPDARLTATQKYIFHAIMSLFGQDIEQNICSMITFADGQDPPVIASLEEADLPFGRYFTFNNSGLFSKNTNLDNASLSPMFWEMGVKSYRAFFENLAKMESKSLSLTKEVLEERQKLELTISSLQPQVDAGLSKLTELKQELKIIEQHRADITDNKNFEYEVDETRQIMKDLPVGLNVTNCLHCNITCHENCHVRDDEQKARCSAMDRNGYCRVCPGNCTWSEHKNTPYIFDYVTEKVRKTYQEKLQRYQDASGQLLGAEQLLENMYDEFEELEDGIQNLMEEVNLSTNRLKEIALRPNPLTMVEHLDLMIEAEKFEKKEGYQGRIKALMEYREKAEITKGVERFHKEASGTGRRKPTVKKEKSNTKFSFVAFLKKHNPF